MSWKEFYEINIRLVEIERNCVVDKKLWKIEKWWEQGKDGGDLEEIKGQANDGGKLENKKLKHCPRKIVKNWIWQVDEYEASRDHGRNGETQSLRVKGKKDNKWQNKSGNWLIETRKETRRIATQQERWESYGSLLRTNVQQRPRADIGCKDKGEIRDRT